MEEKMENIPAFPTKASGVTEIGANRLAPIPFAPLVTGDETRAAQPPFLQGGAR